MLPREFLDDAPRILFSFIVRDFDDAVPGVRLEGGGRLSVLEHKIGASKAEPFLERAREIRRDGVRGRKHEVAHRLEFLGLGEEVLSSPTNLVQVIDQEALDEGLIFLKLRQDGFDLLRFEVAAGQGQELLDRHHGEIGHEGAKILLAQDGSFKRGIHGDRPESSSEILDDVT